MIAYIDAEDEIFGVAFSAWKAAQVSLGLSYEPTLYFPDQIEDTPDVTQIYGQCSFTIVIGQQASLSRYQGVSIHENIGLFVLQVYSPKLDSSAARNAKLLADQLHTAFCKPSPSGSIWFTKQKVAKVAGNATKNQVNVVVTCTFKTAK